MCFEEEHGFYFDNLNNLLAESHIVDTLSGLLSWHDERRLLLLLSMLVRLMRFGSENASWNIKIVGEEIYRSDSRRVFCSSGGESIWILSFATTSGSVYKMNTFAFLFCATPALRIVNYIFIIVHFGDKFINNLRTGETYQRNDLWAPHLLRLCVFNDDDTVRSRMGVKFGNWKALYNVCQSLFFTFLFYFSQGPELMGEG